MCVESAGKLLHSVGEDKTLFSINKNKSQAPQVLHVMTRITQSLYNSNNSKDSYKSFLGSYMPFILFCQDYPTLF